MINKILREDYPDFDLFLEDFTEHSYREHRRGSNFYTRSIVEINEEYYPEVSRELDGFWETNDYVSDSKYGTDRDEIYQLNRVEKKEKIVKSFEWVKV